MERLHQEDQLDQSLKTGNPQQMQIGLEGEESIDWDTTENLKNF